MMLGVNSIKVRHYGQNFLFFGIKEENGYPFGQKWIELSQIVIKFIIDSIHISKGELLPTYWPP